MQTYARFRELRVAAVGLALLTASAGTRARAQYVDAAVGIRPRGSESAQPLRAVTVTAEEAGRVEPVIQSGLLGAAVGAAVGVVYALVATHAGHYSDHSEDVYAYMVFVPAGAVVGAVTGAVVGLVRGR